MNTIMYTRIVAFLLLIAVIAPAASAQDTVPEPLKKLHSILGEWEGAGTLKMGEETVAVRIRHVTKSIANGQGLQTDEWVEIPGMGTTSGVNLFGYNEGDGLIHLYCVMSDGAVHDHTGQWSDDGVLTLQHAGRQNGKTFSEVIPIWIDGNNAYHFIGRTFENGELTSELTGTMKRVGQSLTEN